jgi:hypothetical protein
VNHPEHVQVYFYEVVHREERQKIKGPAFTLQSPFSIWIYFETYWLFRMRNLQGYARASPA